MNRPSTSSGRVATTDEGEASAGTFSGPLFRFTEWVRISGTVRQLDMVVKGKDRRTMHPRWEGGKCVDIGGQASI